MTYIRTASFHACTVRGNMQEAVDWSDSGSTFSGNLNVFNSDSFGQNFSPYNPNYFVGCTEEQLKDPEYLRSLGFPIIVR